MKKQPFEQPSEWKFVDALQKEQGIVANWPLPRNRIQPNIICAFSDPEGVLQSAVSSLRRYMFQTIGFSYPVILQLAKRNWKKETFELVISGDSAQITGDGLEGLRRGIYELIRMWNSSLTPHIVPQKIRRTAWVRNRISRCFFSPINRPPANRDELLDDQDYYPEPYLDRLAASGVNGLYISAGLDQLCATSFSESVDPDIGKRIEKLQKIVERCRRYGIRIFLQMNEPAARAVDSPFYKKNPSIRGVESFGRNCFCPSSAEGKKYLEEACRYIFSSVKDLGGILNITLGEGLTTCASADHTKCPRCSRVEWKEILFQTWRAMRKGMDAANPEADLICWLYLPFIQKHDERILSLLEGTPERVIIQLNCESGGTIRQNGKDYTVGDYWLAMDHPSEIFTRFAQKAEENGVEISAKIQVGCSHEVATVPFVPVPGLLYRKYRALRKLKVANIMQCWYFGNYPGLMNDAAGQLSFTPFHPTETAFLQNLAAVYWGRERSRAANVWMAFGDAYREYPASNMIQYFGPVADGISWPLYFQAQNRGLTSTWLLEPQIGGDNIVECLKDMTMEDVLVQMEKLSSQWHRALMQYISLREQFRERPLCQLEINVAEALDIQFQSAWNILKFYQARSQMLRLVDQEIINTRRMIQLTKRESLLGFHSEAEGYKYYPAKLEWRLKQLLKENACEEYEMGSGWIECKTYRWKADLGENSSIHFQIEMRGFLPGMDEFYFGMDDRGTSFPALFHADYRKNVFVCHSSIGCKLDVQNSGWSIDLVIEPEKYSKNRPLRINLIRLTDNYQFRDSWPQMNVFLPPRLGMIFYQPANMGILRFQKTGK